MERVIWTMVLLAPLSWAAAGSLVLPQDKGPDRIDVSAYPAPQQAAYNMFSTKCSKCHTLARPINTTMKPEEWERYVKRMMHKPNSGISDSQQRVIFEFLAFDQTARKDKNLKAYFPVLSDEEIGKLQRK